MGFQWMCFPNSQIEINIRFFVLLLKEMQHNSLKSMKKSMKIKEKISIFDINLRLYILHNIQWFKHEPTSGHWFLVGRFYRVRTMIVTLKIVPKKLGSMVFQWHGLYVCQCLILIKNMLRFLFLVLRSGQRSPRCSAEILHSFLPGLFVISWTKLTLTQRLKISSRKCSSSTPGRAWQPSLPWRTPSSRTAGPVPTTPPQVPQTPRETPPRGSQICQTPQ